MFKYLEKLKIYISLRTESKEHAGDCQERVPCSQMLSFPTQDPECWYKGLARFGWIVL